ncbi:MAG TPA: sigma 54-interacting transcriptional regulator [Myxococcota bacterium]|nr:sigma 54-interacting transcriptional regulator [Myxococcota bacterium]
MQRFAPLLLDVWRETGRHIEIGDALARSAPLLARRLPLDFALVRRIDPARMCVETVAATASRPGPLPEETRSDLGAPELEALLAWARAGRVVHRRARALAEQLPGLLPDAGDADVIAGPLTDEGGAAGVLILAARRPRRFEGEHVELAEALREPFTAALENDLRVRELATQQAAAEADRSALLSRLGRSDLQETIVGAEGGFRPVIERASLVAPSDVPVLILGETGSGKEVVARAIHQRSRRAGGPFLRVNCGAIPSGLVDSELFGHERGSFTGAAGQRRGWFERADGGTLFLDEVGELPPPAQVRLLRILQDGSFERVGGQRPLHVDVRIVAATHRDLERMVAEGQFREDLWYRLAVFPIHVPPLRDRPEDIPPLATHFALRAAARFGTAPRVPSPEELNQLLDYAWPGNVRELAAVIERAVILGEGRGLEVGTALGLGRSSAPTESVRQTNAAPQRPAPDPRATPSSAPFPTLDDAIRTHIEQALARTRGRIEGARGAAALLAINPHTLRARMRKLRVDWQRFRD